MRTYFGALAALVGALGGAAAADPKIVDMTPRFAKESTGCEVQARGLARIATGAAALVTAHPDDATLVADTARVTAGLEQVRAYCAEVGAMVDFLREHAKTPYRTIEKQLDARDNAIRTQRRAIKQLTTELAPITKRLIPLITAQRTAAPPPTKLTAAKFPSGRAIELPKLGGGSWKLSGTAHVDTADYSEGRALVASLAARARVSVGCDTHRITLEKTATIEHLVDAEIPSSAKDLGIAWRITYTRREGAASRYVSELCAVHGTDTYRVSSLVIPASNTALAEQLVPLQVRMLAAQLPPPRS